MKIYESVEQFAAENSGIKTAVALGYFDGVHVGHQSVIKKIVSNVENMVPVVLTFSTSGFNNKGEQILTQQGRFMMLKKLGVEIVVALDFEQIKDIDATTFVKDILINKLGATMLSCGFNYKFGAKGQGDTSLLKSLCEKYNVALSVEPELRLLNEPVSATRIKNYLQQGDIKKANALLGYYYFIENTVVKGHQLGRTLGFPTINQNFDTAMLIPKFGIYATITTIGEKSYKSVTNIGVKPTILGDRLPLSETYIIDYSGDLYDQVLKVEFIDFIRSEEKFDNLDQLIKAIAKDVDKACDMHEKKRN